MPYKHLLILFTVFIFYASPLTACSCLPDIPLQQQFSMASQIFIGTAVNVTNDHHQMVRHVVFRVEENFKGLLPSNGCIRIVTHTMESACGLSIEKNEKWQIWAGKSYVIPNQLEVFYCSESTKDVQKNLPFLRNQLPLPLTTG